MRTHCFARIDDKVAVDPGQSRLSQMEALLRRLMGLEASCRMIPRAKPTRQSGFVSCKGNVEPLWRRGPTGRMRVYNDDLEQFEAGMILYDAFYRWCRDATHETHNWPNPRTGQ